MAEKPGLTVHKKQFLLIGQAAYNSNNNLFSITYCETPGEIDCEELQKLRLTLYGTYRLLQTDRFRRQAFEIGKRLSSQMPKENMEVSLTSYGQAEN